MTAHRQAILGFAEGAPATKTPRVRGGKGAGLADMVEFALPVPPGFTIVSGVSRAHSQTGCLPRRVPRQIEQSIRMLERQTGRTFGDPLNPLLVSVRSGAEVSMPGMMDTILNVGLDTEDLSGLIRLGSRRFARNTRDRFIDQWMKLFGEEPPRDPRAQLFQAIEAVMTSWNSERAVLYRRQHTIPDWTGTAVTVQVMVFGNLNDQSCTGVVFSCNVSTGEEGLYGEFLPKAQGEDVVAGTQTPRPILELKLWNPTVYCELEDYVTRLAERLGDDVDVEFTVEDGVLYILQYRRAKRSPLAEVVTAVRRVWSGSWTKEEALRRVPGVAIEQLQECPEFSQDAVDSAPLITKGLAASPGAATGVVVFTSDDACDLAEKGHDVVLVRQDTSPEDLPGMLVSKAIVTATGGATCHAAIVARELGLPAIVGAHQLDLGSLSRGSWVSVDGTRGVMLRGRIERSTPEPPKEVTIFLRWVKKETRYKPVIGFDHVLRPISANASLNDFYLTDAMARESVGTRLEEEVHQLRDTIHRDIAERFAAYLLLAIGGEARYSVDYCTLSATSELQKIERTINRLVPTLLREPNQFAAQSAILHAARSLSPDVLLTLVEALMGLFEKGQWTDSGYGGASWGAIARALGDFLAGRLTPSLFVDHVFDLRHNGGVLFDKHEMVGGTNEARLLEQLEHKKRCRTARDLHYELSLYAPISRVVRDLWGKWSGMRQ